MLINRKKKYGLVLAGGGTKGAYQIGAWQAIKKLNINIGAIVGTSIGAINGAFMVQDDIEKMEKLYENIELKNVVSVKKKLDTKKDIFSSTNILKLLSDFIEQKGFENTPLRNIIEENIDIDKIYNSKVDFGMVSYSIKRREPLEVFKKDIPKEKFIDYLLASACFPIYKAQKINNIEYYDGGFYDNMPINLLLKKNYKNIIVIDVSGIGLKKKVSDKKVYIKRIKNSEDLGGTFEFNHEKISNNIILGYLDTMRAFNKLEGHIYYFQKKEFEKMLKIYNVQIIYGLEIAAKLLDINKYKVYRYKEFINEIIKQYKLAKKEYEKIKEDLHIKSIKVLKEVLSKYKKYDKTLKQRIILIILEDILSSKPTLEEWKILNQFEEYKIAINAIKEIKEL